MRTDTDQIAQFLEHIHVVCILSMYTNTDQIAHLENWSTVPSWQDCNTDPEEVKIEIFLFVLWEI